MAETPTCSCGTNEPKRIIFSCAGVANVGQLTNQASLELATEGYGVPSCIALLASGAEALVTSAKGADEVLILDGCPMICAKKIADAHQVPVAQHLVVTDLGIVKGPSKSYTEEDVETVVSAAWRGEGKKKGVSSPTKKNRGSNSGCGCGGTC